MTPLIAIGWTFTSPIYDHAKRLLWLNREVFPLRGIAFEQRLVDQLHGVPILVLDEVIALPPAERPTCVALSANPALLASATSRLSAAGIPVITVRELLAQHAAGAGWAALRSPFPHIPLAAFGRAWGPRAAVTDRLADDASLALYARLVKTFETVDLSMFYGPTEHITEDMFLAGVLDAYFAAGTRELVLTGDDVALTADILLQLAPAYTEGQVVVHAASARALGPRVNMYREVLGADLHETIVPDALAGCIVADSLAEWTRLAAAAPAAVGGAHAVIRLRGSLADLDALATALDTQRFAHRVTLRQISVEPSLLFAILAPQ